MDVTHSGCDSFWDISPAVTALQISTFLAPAISESGQVKSGKYYRTELLLKL
jgi:hypothetical protein